MLWDLGGGKAKKQDGKRPKRAAAGLLSCDEPAHVLVAGPAEAAGDFLVSAAACGGWLHGGVRAWQAAHGDLMPGRPSAGRAQLRQQPVP